MKSVFFYSFRKLISGIPNYFTYFKTLISLISKTMISLIFRKSTHFNGRILLFQNFDFSQFRKIIPLSSKNIFHSFQKPISVISKNWFHSFKENDSTHLKKDHSFEKNIFHSFPDTYFTHFKKLIFTTISITHWSK